MLIKKYFLDLSLTLITSFFQNSFLENTIPKYSFGFYGSPELSAFNADYSSCVQTCWKKIESGALYEGAVINYNDKQCFCSITQIGLPLNYMSNRESISFLFSIFQPESEICSIGSYINFRVRISFYLEGKDESTLYFIDDLDNSIDSSGRIIITQFINRGRGFHSSIKTERNKKSKLYSSVKETYSGNVNSKFENFYDLETKIGDMSVEYIHTEWAVLTYSTIDSLRVTLTPFTIQRPIRKCSLIMTASNYTLNQNMFINLNLTTSADCVADLESISIFIEHHRRFKFKRLILDNLSINPTSMINHKYYDLIYIEKIYIDSFLKFSVDYEIDTLFVFGKEVISTITTINWNECTDDKSVTFLKRMVFNSIVELTRKAFIQTFPKLDMTSETTFENKTHLYECMSVEKREPSPCFQLEKSTGQIMYFPIHVLKLIGYDPLTNFFYGKTFRENIIQVDIYGKKPVVIITKDKWLSAISSSRFQIVDKIQ
ncbi:uncharacterized protein LOC105847127 [Hydra vulgaris]|uniref:uncharacterized protein LOC105847127 n=1 Tax=Hydra vulgaris TaxID=6087 RepID=UPI001F5F0F8E|nr:uncharacterized protein LOC105847127 [Hydra vulgaris]